MPLRRTIVALSSLLAAALAGAGTSARAHAPTGAGPPPTRILFPVVGPAQFSDDFGAPRAQGGHQANDLLAAWRAPLVAVEDGTVKLWTHSASAGCMLYLYGRSGTTYQYVHLNNDLTARNDNRGGCNPGVAYAPGLVDGQRVRAGQLLGFVGDSGDAAGKHPHVHFELHPRDGAAVSPFPWLRRARRLLYAAPNDARPFTLTLSGSIRSSVSPGATVDNRRLAITVRRVRLSNGSTLPSDRAVVVRVSPAALVQHRAAVGVRSATIEEAAPGEAVSAAVEIDEPTLRTQLAAPGVLEVNQLLLQGTA